MKRKSSWNHPVYAIFFFIQEMIKKSLSTYAAFESAEFAG